MLRPVVIDGRASAQCVECELQSIGAFTVSFGPTMNGLLHDADECFRGSIVLEQPGALRTSRQPVALAVADEHGSNHLDVHGFGLYGDASYRVFDDAWSASGCTFATFKELVAAPTEATRHKVEGP